MWGVGGAAPAVSLPIPSSVTLILALLFTVTGLGVAGTGAGAFRRAATTVDPTRPERASTLVSNGIYRYTRNPMYLGMAFVLLGWSVYLANLGAIVLVAIFVAYITRFQIVPEERELSRLFGDAYSKYKATVRRWL